MTRTLTNDSLLAALETAALGAVAGVIASAATARFQAGWAGLKLPPTNTPSPEAPPTNKLADEICSALTSKTLPRADVGPAGSLIHYAMGAAMGAAYGLLTRRYPEARAGKGVAFGLAMWATVEEMGLALMGLKPPPWKVEPAEHLFAASSHVVFGLSLDTALEAVPPLPARLPSPRFLERVR